MRLAARPRSAEPFGGRRGSDEQPPPRRRGRRGGPTTNVPNTAAGYLDADDASLGARGWYDRIFSTAGFTPLSNMTGNPAISLPLGTSAEGWPVGVQLVAPYTGEATLLALAADLERTLPWADRRPGTVVG